MNDLQTAMISATSKLLYDLDMDEVGVRISRGNWATHFSPSKMEISFGDQCIELLSTGKYTKNGRKIYGGDLSSQEYMALGWEEEHGKIAAIRLAYVIIHETAHAIIHKLHLRKQGVVHGEAFYAAVMLLESRLDDLAQHILDFTGDSKLLKNVSIRNILKPSTKLKNRISTAKVMNQAGLTKGWPGNCKR